MSTRRAQIRQYRCRTGTVVWRVGLGTPSCARAAPQGEKRGRWRTKKTGLNLSKQHTFTQGREAAEFDPRVAAKRTCVGGQFNKRDCAACQWSRWSNDLSFFTTEEEKLSSDRYRCLWISRWMEDGGTLHGWRIARMVRRQLARDCPSVEIIKLVHSVNYSKFLGELLDESGLLSRSPDAVTDPFEGWKVKTEHLTNESHTRFQTLRKFSEQGRQNSSSPKNERMRQRPFHEVL